MLSNLIRPVKLLQNYRKASSATLLVMVPNLESSRTHLCIRTTKSYRTMWLAARNWWVYLKRVRASRVITERTKIQPWFRIFKFLILSIRSPIPSTTSLLVRSTRKLGRGWMAPSLLLWWTYRSFRAGTRRLLSRSMPSSRLLMRTC